MFITIVPATLSASLRPSSVANTIIGSISHPTIGMQQTNAPIKARNADVALVQLELSVTLITFIFIALLPQLCPSPNPSLINA